MKKISLLILFPVFGLLVAWSFNDAGKFLLETTSQSSGDKISSKAKTENVTYLVKRVVDGDTIELENGQKVRYIGVNTPETVDPRKPVECFGQEAKEENRKLTEGKTVRLEKDISETDKFGRLLRYVYIGDLFVNDYLVRQGFAQTATFPPDVKYVSQFLEAQREAKENKRGLWGDCNYSR